MSTLRATMSLHLTPIQASPGDEQNSMETRMAFPPSLGYRCGNKLSVVVRNVHFFLLPCPVASRPHLLPPSSFNISTSPAFFTALSYQPPFLALSLPLYVSNLFSVPSCSFASIVPTQHSHHDQFHLYPPLHYSLVRPF